MERPGPRAAPTWPVAPPILEEIYTMEDALAFGGACISLLCDGDLGAANTRDEPERVAPAPLREVTVRQDRVNLTLQPASWNLVRLTSA